MVKIEKKTNGTILSRISMMLFSYLCAWIRNKILSNIWMIFRTSAMCKDIDTHLQNRIYPILLQKKKIFRKLCTYKQECDWLGNYCV